MIGKGVLRLQANANHVTDSLAVQRLFDLVEDIAVAAVEITDGGVALVDDPAVHVGHPLPQGYD